MKNLKRQDRNGVRHVADIERKYKLGQIDYTTEEIERLKMEFTVDSSLSTSSIRPVQNKVVTNALSNKVNKEAGKELSSNDFTDELKEKLDKAQENVIENILVNGVEQETINKSVNIQADKNVIESISVNGEAQEIENKNVNLTFKELSLLDVYPVGSIYMSVNSTNPSTLFGGTWEAWGAGRVPVGIDTTQTEFATVEQQGGERSHKLEVYEMPSHRHNLANYNVNGADLPTSSLMIGTTATGWEGSAFTAYEGGGQAHNNLQPYITCYMWKRTN